MCEFGWEALPKKVFLILIHRKPNWLRLLQILNYKHIWCDWNFGRQTWKWQMSEWLATWKIEAVMLFDKWTLVQKMPVKKLQFLCTNGLNGWKKQHALVYFQYDSSALFPLFDESPSFLRHSRKHFGIEDINFSLADGKVLCCHSWTCWMNSCLFQMRNFDGYRTPDHKFWWEFWRTFPRPFSFWIPKFVFEILRFPR